MTILEYIIGTIGIISLFILDYFIIKHTLINNKHNKHNKHNKQ